VGVAVSLLLVAGSLERERTSFLLCIGTFAMGLLIYGIANLSSNRKQ